MLVADLLGILERLAPASLAQPGDSSGMLVGDERAAVRRVLVALELTDAVLEEALAGGCDTILSHHPLLFAPVRSLVESRYRERLLRRLVAEHMTLVACHTNLDAAPGGLADIAGEALGLRDMAPLELADAGWFKLVGFVPAEAVDGVAAAVFATGAGGIGDYRECAFAAEGTGWFTPMPGSHPAVGQVSRRERTAEVRWETVVPRKRLTAAIRAFVNSHPYEEPAFDAYPVEDVLPGAGLGRVGDLSQPMSVSALAARVAEVFEVNGVSWSGDGGRLVNRVAVLPGSGRGSVDNAAGQCEVLVTGDVGYHAADQAAERGMALVDVPHGDFEWWAFRRWSGRLEQELAPEGVTVSISRAWRSPWNWARQSECCSSEGREVAVTGAAKGASGKLIRMWIDGGSRGNPGPSAIGVVAEDEGGKVLETIAQVIGVGTNNVAEYQALLIALEAASRLGFSEVDVASDSELLVKQMRGEYKVKNEGLRGLHEEARRKAESFATFAIRHIGREENGRADALVNKALDENATAGL